MNLRPYQHLAMLDIARRWRSGVQRVLAVAPTGAGKTTLGAAIVAEHLAAGARVIWMAHRRELIGQAACRMRRFGLNPGVVMGQARRHELGDPRGPFVADTRLALQVASVDTLRNRAVPAPDLLVVDEAHRAVSPTYAKIAAQWPRAQVLGLTATPWRLDGRGLGEAFDALVTVSTVPRLIELGHLVDVECWAAWAPDLQGVRRQAGEYAAKKTEERMQAGLGDVVRGIAREHDCGRTVAFCATVAHSEALAAALRDAGLRAEHLDGTTPGTERAGILGRLATGETQVVSNVAVLTEGYDLPDLETVVLARPTASSALYLQAVGRGLRPAPGKASMRLLDYGGNVARHWWPTSDVSAHYSLEGAPAVRAGEQEDAPSVTQCLECFAIYRSGAGACPHCGASSSRQKPVVVEDRGTTLRKADRAKSALPAWARSPQGPRFEALCAWIEQAETHGYKAGWAAMQFKRQYGHWPFGAWMVEARELVAQQAGPRAQVAP